LRRRGQVALLAAAMLSLAVIAYLNRVESLKIRVTYHGEAEWMILLAAARHSLASNESLDVLIARLSSAASRNGVWLPPVEWNSSHASWGGNTGGGWAYRADFYNTSLGWRGYFAASTSYVLLGAEYDDHGNLWLVYNLTYLHEYRLPQYSYSITLHPEPLNTTCSRVYAAGEGEWIAKLSPPCTLKDKWGIAIISVEGG